MGWERNHILLLINLYQKEPVLYCTTHKDYRNRYKREAAWNRILEAVSTKRPNTGVRDIRDKIENLRTVYALQKRKVENVSKKKGKTGKTYISTVWYYSHLSFLNEHLQPRKNKNEDTDHLDCDILNSNGYEVIVKNFLKHKNGKQELTAKDSEKWTNKSKRQKSQNKNTNDKKTNPESIEDKYSLFGAYVADRLKCMETEISHKLEDDILRLVMEVERRKY